MKKLILILTVVVVLSFVHVVTVTATDQTEVFQVDSGNTLETNLRGYWNLSDANDFFNGYNLTSSGTVGFVVGKVNNGANVTSTGQIKRADAAAVDGASISFAGWFRPNSNPASGEDDIVLAQSAPTSGVSYAIQYQNEGAVLKLKFLRTKRGVAEESFQTTYTLPTTTSTHLALTWSSTSSILSGYVSSTFMASTTASGNGTGDSIVEVCVGCWRGISPIVDGAFDEWSLWAKELTQTEVNDLFNGNAGQTMVAAPAAAPARGQFIFD